MEKLAWSTMRTAAQPKFREAVGKHWDCPESTEAIKLAWTPQLSGDSIVLGTVMEVIVEHPFLLGKPEIEVILCKVLVITCFAQGGDEAIRPPIHEE